MEAPRLVIDDVIKLEKKAMKKRVAYMEFFMHAQEKQMKAAELARKKKKEEENAAKKKPKRVS